MLFSGRTKTSPSEGSADITSVRLIFIRRIACSRIRFVNSIAMYFVPSMS